tara:strand:- start:28442 stop:28783 length:342 start_codon:yes stop_codon:yes gene_type:complete
VLDNDTSEGTTKVDIYSLELNYTLDDFLLTSISAYTNENVFGSTRADDYTHTALPLNDSNEKYDQYSQEFRLTSPSDGAITYVGGQETEGVEATQILHYTYKRRFGVSVQMDW